MKKALAALIVVVVFCGLAIVGKIFFFADDPAAGERAAVASSGLKPGVYKVEYDKIDSHGWRAYFSMTVDRYGEVGEVTYNYLNSAGAKKTEDAGYNKAMTKNNGLGPESYCPRFEKNLIIYQNPDKVDAITGATSSYETFKTFAATAFQSAKQGNTAPITLVQPDPEKTAKEVKK